MQANTGIIRTKMSEALIGAFDQAVSERRNLGRLGKRILTNKIKGVGIKYMPRSKAKESTADSAERKAA